MGIQEQALQAFKRKQLIEIGRLLAFALFAGVVFYAVQHTAEPYGAKVATKIHGGINKLQAAFKTADQGAPAAQGGDPRLEGL